MKTIFSTRSLHRGDYPLRFMRIVVVAMIVLLSLEACHSQNLLSLPESIIYDSVHYRYLISNCQTGDIIQVDSNGVQSYFVQGGHAIQGLEIVGNAVYVGCDSLVRGFDLGSGAMVMDVHVSGVSNLNDVTADASGNLYVSDVFGTKIIKVNISTQNWWVFVNGQGIDHPNGLFYDKSYNRILVCSYRYHSPVQAISLADSSVSTLATTKFSDCYGITKDKYGRAYVTSWQTLSIYQFDSTFLDPPVKVYTNACGPADISYDRTHDVIAIPLQGCNSWATLHLDPPVGIRPVKGSFPRGSIDHFKIGPNPFYNQTVISFETAALSLIRIEIIDKTGNRVKLLTDEMKAPGQYTVIWDGTNEAGNRVAGGYYFILFRNNENRILKKALLLS